MNELVLPFAVMVLTAGMAVFVLGCVRKWLAERDAAMKEAEAAAKPKAPHHRDYPHLLAAE